VPVPPVHKEKGEACGLEKGSEAGPGDACKAISEEEKKVEAARNRQEATVRVLQTAASTRVSTLARSTRVSGVGGLTRTPTPQLARELRLMQDNFLAEDAVDAFLPACLVELGLHNDPGSVAGRALDMLAAELASARAAAADSESEIRDLQMKGVSEDADKLRVEKQALERATLRAQNSGNALRTFLENPEALIRQLPADPSADPHAKIFQTVLTRWNNGLSEADEHSNKEPVSINDVAAAANLSRRSLLAKQCVVLLPEHLSWTRRNAQSFKNKRLEAMTKIEVQWQQESSIPERKALLTEFQKAMSACKDGDAKQRSECEAAVRGIVVGVAVEPTKPATREL
jgi:hypothetical protein